MCTISTLLLLVSSSNDVVYKDAIYFSMHKFIGGVGAPGVLVAKKHLFTNKVPGQCGGGTVFFVSDCCVINILITGAARLCLLAINT